MISCNLRLQRCSKKGVKTRLPDYQVGRVYIVCEFFWKWDNLNHRKLTMISFPMSWSLHTKCIKSVHFYLQIKLSKSRWKRWKVIFCRLVWKRVWISVLMMVLFVGCSRATGKSSVRVLNTMHTNHSYQRTSCSLWR